MAMTNAIQIFNYKSNKVRTVEQDGQVWFVAKDVCDILEIKNHKDAIKELDGDEKSGVAITDPIGRKQVTNVISEAGVYTLTMKSRKPEAKNFRRWITHEVLPAIMRTGSYSVKVKHGDGDEVLALAQRVIEQHETIQALEEKIEDDKEKVDFAEAVSHSGNSYSWQDMANSMAQNGADIGQNRAVKWGLENRYLCRRSGHSYLQPTLKAIKQGLLEVDLRTRAVRITPKGIFKLTCAMDKDRTEWLFDPEEEF